MEKKNRSFLQKVVSMTTASVPALGNGRFMAVQKQEMEMWKGNS